MPLCAIRFEWIQLEQQNIHDILPLFESLSVNSENFLNIYNSNSDIVNDVITYIVQFFTNLCGWTEDQSLLWIEHERDDIENVNSLFYHEEISYWVVDELIPENIRENDQFVKTIRKRLLCILNTETKGIQIDWQSVHEKISCVLSEFNTMPINSYSFPIHRLYSSFLKTMYLSISCVLGDLFRKVAPVDSYSTPIGIHLKRISSVHRLVCVVLLIGIKYSR
jgi:hypothetical protein